MAKIDRRFGRRSASKSRGIQTVRVFRAVRNHLVSRGLRVTPHRRLVIARSLVALARLTRSAYRQEAAAPTEGEVARHNEAIREHVVGLLQLIDLQRRDDKAEALADAAWSTLLTTDTRPTLPDRDTFVSQLRGIDLTSRRANIKPRKGRSPLPTGFRVFAEELADRYERLFPVTAGGSRGTSERSSAFVQFAWSVWHLVEDLEKIAQTTFDERIAKVVYKPRVSKRRKISES